MSKRRRQLLTEEQARCLINSELFRDIMTLTGFEANLFRFWAIYTITLTILTVFRCITSLTPARVRVT